MIIVDIIALPQIQKQLDDDVNGLGPSITDLLIPRHNEIKTENVFRNPRTMKGH